MLNNYIDTTSTKNCSTSYLIRSASTVDLNMEGNFPRSMGCLEFWNAPQNKSVLTQSDKRMFPPQFAKWLSVKKNWSLKNWLSAVMLHVRSGWCTKIVQNSDVSQQNSFQASNCKPWICIWSGISGFYTKWNSLVFWFSSRKSCWCLLGKTAKKISSVKDKAWKIRSQFWVHKKKKKLKRVKFNLGNRRSVGGWDWVNVVFGIPVG